MTGPMTGPQDAPTLRITVVGAGYVGLITAVGMAELGHRVELVETRTDRLEALRQGRMPFYELGVQEALTRHLDAGYLTVAAAPDGLADAALICVGTPISEDGTSDLSQLRAALPAITAVLTAEAPLVIRSTLPPGASASVASWADVPTKRILSNPEFLRQGTAYEDFLAPARIVIGHFPDVTAHALDVVLGAYARLAAPRLIVDMAAAELIKNGSNAFLALKLSFANEIAAMCEEYGADAGSVLQGIGLDPRIGGTYMRPSFGFGGSCLPKELRAMTAAGRAAGLPMHVAAAASDANAASQKRFAEAILRRLGGGSGQRVAILGLAFKAGTDDVRESPALAVASILIDAGADVVGHDPSASANAVAALPGLRTVDRAEAAIEGADAVVIATEWPEYGALDWAALRSRVRGPWVFDGRRLLDAPALRALGYRYQAVGSPIETDSQPLGSMLEAATARLD